MVAVTACRSWRTNQPRIWQKLVDPVNQVAFAAGTIGDAFGESFRGIIDGSMSAKEALANFFERTAQGFLDMAAQIASQQLVSGITGLIAGAFGGGLGGGLGGGSPRHSTQPGPWTRSFPAPVSPAWPVVALPRAARPYIVGENGPELFVPGADGTVINADDTREAAAEALGVMGAVDADDGEGATRRSTARALGVMGAVAQRQGWR